MTGKLGTPHSRKALCLSVLTLFLFAPPVNAQSDLAIKDATILTMAGRAIESGTVLMRDGKIVSVGSNVAIPAGATVVSAQGKYVMPGIVDAMSYYGIRHGLNDPENPSTPDNKVIRGYYVFGELYEGEGGVQRDKEILSGGVTTVYIAPGDKQVIGGQGAVVKTTGKDFESLIIREPAAIDMALGDPPKRPPAERKSPATRMGIATLIRKALLGAQEFDATMKAYEEKSEEEKAKDGPPARDLANEALVKLLHREIPARVECDFVDDIRTALRLTEEFDLDLIIDSGVGAYKLKDILAAKNIPVVLGPPTHPFITGGEVSMTPDLEREMNNRNAAILNDAGVKIAIASFGFSFGSFGGATTGRWLLIEAAYAAGFGLSDEDALRTITINPAEILGVSERVGSLEAGKDADILILSGPPLQIKTQVEQVYIDGKKVFDSESD